MLTVCTVKGEKDTCEFDVSSSEMKLNKISL